MPQAKFDVEVSPKNPCPFLRALVRQELLADEVAAIGDITATIVEVAKAGDGSPSLPPVAIRLIALIANGLGPFTIVRNARSGLRLHELRNGPLDKRGAGSRVLDLHGQVNIAELERVTEFASDKQAADGTLELGLDTTDLTRMADENFARAEGNRRWIDRKLMNGEWSVLLKVMGKDGKDGRYISIAEVHNLLIDLSLPERMMKKLKAS